MGILSGITQGNKENLHEYIDCFTKVVMAIRGSDESLKHWIFEKGNDLLGRAQTYMNYEEKHLADRVSYVPGSARSRSSLEKDVGRSKEENECGPHSRLDAYTPLNTSWERILKKFNNT